MSDHAPNRTPARPPGRVPAAREPLWRHIVGDVLRRERRAQERTLKEVADAARISMPYLSEVERGRKEASSEVLAAAAHALGLGLADLLALAQGELARLAPAQPAERRLALAARPEPDAADAAEGDGAAPSASVVRLAVRRGKAPAGGRYDAFCFAA